MTSYPSGAMQNYAPPYAPLQLQPVHQNNWRMFSTLADAQTGLQMIQSVAPNAQMENATSGMYGQFWYFEQDPDIRARIATGTVDQYGQTLRIEEFPSDIFDRYYQPMPFVDQYQPGQPHYLRVGVAAPELGQLYWSA